MKIHLFFVYLNRYVEHSCERNICEKSKKTLSSQILLFDLFLRETLLMVFQMKTLHSQTEYLIKQFHIIISRNAEYSEQIIR